MIRRPPRATRTDTLFPTRRASDLDKGKFRVAGTDKEKSIAEIAFTAYVPHNYPADVEPGLAETAFYDPLNFTYPAGVRICEVEIDPATGITEVVDCVAVDGRLRRASRRERVRQNV